MSSWSRFFLGTPRRFLATFTVVGLVIVMTNPGLLETAVNRFVAAITPLLGPALTIVIVLGGLRIVFRGWR